MGASPHTQHHLGASPHTPGIFPSQRTGGEAFYQMRGMIAETITDIVRFSGMPMRMKSVNL